MKIKGWKKVSTTPFRIIYRNLESGTDIILKKWDEKKWDVFILKIGISRPLKRGTKEQALKFAINYMRKHPKGLIFRPKSLRNWHKGMRF